MQASAQVILFPRESRAGALALLRRVCPHLPAGHPLGPVLVYLDTLGDSGRRSQRGCLQRAALLLGADFESFDWGELRAGHLEYLRGVMKREFSPARINATLSALKGVARWTWHLGRLSEREYLLILDVRGVRAGRRVRRVRALSPDEITALFLSCERDGTPTGVRDACLLSLLYAGGLRSREAVALSVADYVSRKGTLYVNGKGGRERRAYFGDGGARRALHAWLRLRGEGQGPLLHPVTKSGEILQRPLSQRGLYRALERRAEHAGVSHFSPHDLRRSFATHLDEEGESLDMIKELLGHVHVATTGRYIIRSERRKREAALKVGVPFRGRRKGRRRRKRRGHKL